MSAQQNPGQSPSPWADHGHSSLQSFGTAPRPYAPAPTTAVQPYYQQQPSYQQHFQQPYPAVPYPASTMITTPAVHQTSTATVVIAWILAVLTGLYMLPWAVAATRNRSNQGAIGLLNLLLGWSIVGWVVALVMACGSEPQPQVAVTHHYAGPPYLR